MKSQKDVYFDPSIIAHFHTFGVEGWLEGMSAVFWREIISRVCLRSFKKAFLCFLSQFSVNRIEMKDNCIQV